MLKRLENMKLTAASQTKTACSICGHEFGLLLKSSTRCAECGRLVCHRCSMEFTESPLEDSRASANIANISPSRYLPPGSLGKTTEQQTRSPTPRRLWQSRRTSVKREDSKEGLSDLNRSANNRAIGDQSNYKSLLLKRRQSLSRLSNLFSLPISFSPSVTLMSTSNRFHICKLCCEAREVSIPIILIKL